MDEQTLKQALKHYFNFDDFRPGQQETIQAILNHEDTLAILPTGAGKTLLYQLPGYLLPGSVLIVSPLISLMQDQVDRLRFKGERQVVMLNSTLTGTARSHVLKGLAQFRFIFASPEILTQPSIQQALKRCQISLFVVDEAHCVSQWGPDFRPEYLLLNQIGQNLGQPTTLLLTATATPAVQTDILVKLGLNQANVHCVRQSVNRANIFLAVDHVENEQAKRQRLLKRLNELGSGGIIYFSSRKLTDEIATWLNEQTQFKVAAYHAGIDPLDRFRIQQQFMQHQLDVICATSAFGMGIDKDDIRYVIHFHLPGSLESYVQEIGRAGRNQQPALALLMYAPGDETIPRQLSQLELPPASIIEQVQTKQLPSSVLGAQAELLKFYFDHGWSYEALQKMFQERERLANQRLLTMRNYIFTKTCRRNLILKYFGEAPIRANLCCDCHQPNWQIKDLNLPKPQNSVTETDLNWEKRLAKLFNQADKSN